MRHNYKKVLALLATTMVTFSLVACGSEPKNTTTIPQYETDFKENLTDITIDWSQFENNKNNTSSKNDNSSNKDSEKQKVNEYISVIEKKDTVIIYVKDLNAAAALDAYRNYTDTTDKYIELVFEESSKGSTLCEDANFLFGARIKKVTILDDIKTIGFKAFTHCIGLQTINIPDSVTRIEESSFWGCTNLKVIDIPEGVTYIGRRAFCGSGLISVKLPESLTEVISDSFSSCENLTSVTLPANLKSIADDAFESCPKLNTVYGKKGTLAEEFANKNGYTFIAQ